MRGFCAVSFIMLAVWTGIAQANDDSPGRKYFQAAGCEACHRVGSLGGNAGPDLTLVGFRRSKEWLSLWLSDPSAWKHDTLMPNFRLTSKTKEAIVDYLASLKAINTQAFASSLDPSRFHGDSAGQGRVIYIRAGCVACHGAHGIGGHPNNNVPGNRIPALNNASQSFTPEELAAKIRTGSVPAKEDPEGAEPLVSMPAWGTVLDESQIRDVAAYLLSLNSNRGQGSEW